MSQEKNHHKIIIHINNKRYEAPKPDMTGLEIKQLANGEIDYLLVLIVKKPDQQAGGDDIIIGDSQLVHLEQGMRFRIVNPATFG